MTALAGDDNVAFSFTMKADMKKNYTGDRYRETTRTNNPWKVNRLPAPRVSTHKLITSWQATVYVGYNIRTNILLNPETGDHCYKAYAEASKQGVSLGAKTIMM